MDLLRIRGHEPLVGTVAASGSKNAALPIMAASILAAEPVWLENVPHLADVDTLALVLGHLGVEVKRQRDGRLKLALIDPTATRAGYDLVHRMRASFCVLGPLVARRGRATVSLPGGCQIGDRPVDLHLRGLAALGAEIRLCRGYVVARARRLRGARIHLAGPHGPTVTGTANVLCAATLARGRTTITAAATEPEIVDLGNFLNQLGARITGLGSDTLEIVGVESLAGGNYRIIPDRIEAATLLVAGAITGGSVTVTDLVPEHLAAVVEQLERMGVEVVESPGLLRATAPRVLQGAAITANPYPGLPTDVQAQFMALACQAVGRSEIHDRVFPERFGHVAELRRLGARIERMAGGAVVEGRKASSVRRLSGTTVAASDLRASAALVLAGLAARGQTSVRQIGHLDRGYERLDEKLGLLGADIQRSTGTPRPTRLQLMPR